MNKPNRNKLINTENTVMVARGKGDWGVDENGRELRSTNWRLQNSHGDVKYCVGNIVDNAVITLYDVRWVLDLLG